MKKFISISILSSMIALLLTGCSQSGSKESFFQSVLVDPMTKLIEFIAGLADGNFGISIVIMTLLIRLLLMPLAIKQYKAQTQMKTKMDAIKPEMTRIQKNLKDTKDTAKQRELQQELMALYQKNGVNPLNIGCLPILIQMPILMGFYYAIKGSHEIATHNFLWYNLGHSDYIMAIIAGVIYYLQAKKSMQQMPMEQQKSMKPMMLMSPIMILFFSLNAPAALPLYWSIGGLFLIAQSAFLAKFYKKDTGFPSEAATPAVPDK
ncbi:membrane protein insertase YidC [Peribacillus sp. SCS-155]|uniref:membrane protein insertase YidC n=1 Tax=Peribacillus sedimenti TaxID=3115297 RepID=UPI003905EF37